MKIYNESKKLVGLYHKLYNICQTVLDLKKLLDKLGTGKRKNEPLIFIV